MWTRLPWPNLGQPSNRNPSSAIPPLNRWTLLISCYRLRVRAGIPNSSARSAITGTPYTTTFLPVAVPVFEKQISKYHYNFIGPSGQSKLASQSKRIDILILRPCVVMVLCTVFAMCVCCVAVAKPFLARNSPGHEKSKNILTNRKFVPYKLSNQNLLFS